MNDKVTKPVERSEVVMVASSRIGRPTFRCRKCALVYRRSPSFGRQLLTTTSMLERKLPWRPCVRIWAWKSVNAPKPETRETNGNPARANRRFCPSWKSAERPIVSDPLRRPCWNVCRSVFVPMAQWRLAKQRNWPTCRSAGDRLERAKSESALNFEILCRHFALV